MFSNYLLSMMRTLAPILAGWLIAQAVQLGVHLDSTLVVSLLTSVFAGAYYLVVHWAELHIGGRFGRLLGIAAPPMYQERRPGSEVPTSNCGTRRPRHGHGFIPVLSDGEVSRQRGALLFFAASTEGDTHELDRAIRRFAGGGRHGGVSSRVHGRQRWRWSLLRRSVHLPGHYVSRRGECEVHTREEARRRHRTTLRRHRRPGQERGAGYDVTAYEVDGISPKVAIAIGDTPKTARFFAVHSGSELPPEVQKLIDGS